MTKKKTALSNPILKALFTDLKFQTATTSKQIAAALDVSAQTVTSMSGKLDAISVTEMTIIADTMRINPKDFLEEIMKRANCETSLNQYVIKKD